MCCATTVLDGGKVWQKVWQVPMLSQNTVSWYCHWRWSTGLDGLPQQGMAYICSHAGERCYSGAMACSKGHVEVPNISDAGAVYSPWVG